MLDAVFARYAGAKRYIVDLDSMTSMLYAVSHFTKKSGKASMRPLGAGLLGGMTSLIPSPVSKSLYCWSGWWGGIEPGAVKFTDMEKICAWVAERYPRQEYPGAMIGSSNGAAAHLCAAMGIPWLPQTFLLPVRRHLHPDLVIEDMEWGKKPAAELRDANPGLRVHQMHDPVQDRLMLREISYFRVKKTLMGNHYEEFLKKHISPGGFIIQLKCNLSWPVTQVQPGHLFQVGGLGEISPGEYLNGSRRVEDFLSRQKSKLKRWECPDAVNEMPEAEWGYAGELEHDLRRFAAKNGFRLVTVAFRHPEDLSGMVADFYQWWYERLGIRSKRLLLECFAFVEPYWALRTGSIPFWHSFNTEFSVENVRQYLGRNCHFSEIYSFLMSNGVEGIGQATPRFWRRQLELIGQRKLFFPGLRESSFPRDLGSFFLYLPRFLEQVPQRVDLPPELPISQFLTFLEEHNDLYPISLTIE